jgi:CheY-like chemotaxis protein
MFFKKLRNKFRKKKKKSKHKKKKEDTPNSETPPETPERNESFKFKTKNLTYLHLVVDDAKSNRFVLVKFLERLNINCDVAENGELALEKISENDIDKYDILWVDLKMPIMDGIEMVRILRQDQKYNGYIVGVTGNIEKETVEKCLSVGFNKVMSKPILMGDFYALECLQPYQDKK